MSKYGRYYRYRIVIGILNVFFRCINQSSINLYLNQTEVHKTHAHTTYKEQKHKEEEGGEKSR